MERLQELYKKCSASDGRFAFRMREQQWNDALKKRIAEFFQQPKQLPAKLEECWKNERPGEEWKCPKITNIRSGEWHHYFKFFRQTGNLHVHIKLIPSDKHKKTAKYSLAYTQAPVVGAGPSPGEFVVASQQLLQWLHDYFYAKNRYRGRGATLREGKRQKAKSDLNQEL
eukprot:TRINITY_DN65373_c0_g1_i1.p1 TRINITY_DN65373_c0_g1~~TRINITY_DN65373_c0_g1_i1.p1  ORF type:complete len:170 (-),score=24.24 TRINITY_DN65373_c0_g1_i1:538-1047(-)